MGGRSDIPDGMPQGTPGASLQTAGSGGARRRQPGAGFWGRRWASFASRPVRCRQLTASMWCRLLRHGMVPPGTVPPIGGTVSPGDGKARDGRVRRGLAGMLGRPLRPGLVAGPVSARQPPGGAPSGGVPPDIMRGGAGAGPPGKGPAERCRLSAARYCRAGTSACCCRHGMVPTIVGT